MAQPEPPRHAPSTLRNRDPILAVLQRVLPRQGLLLEIASGSGEHAAYMTDMLPGGLEWQPSEADQDAIEDIDTYTRESGSSRIRPAILLDVRVAGWPVDHADAVFCCNMVHIAPWTAAEGLFAGAARILSARAPLILYGPFQRNGSHTAPSNLRFDEALRAQDPCWGIHCLDTEIIPLAQSAGFALDEIVAMPANNLTVIFRRE